MRSDESPRQRSPDSQLTPEAGGPAPGEQVGRHHLLQKIGEGGMGEVWVAEQREPIRRTVAVKVINIGMGTRQVVARFEAERQALAVMDHPAIAKVLDAGATVHGRPYFVMEYVKGEPITGYGDRRHLSTFGKGRTTSPIVSSSRRWAWRKESKGTAWTWPTSCTSSGFSATARAGPRRRSRAFAARSRSERGGREPTTP